MNETRAMRGIEVRAVALDDGGPGVALQVIRPGVVDDYGSLWMPDTFDESLAQRLPTLCWSHDWTEPLGPAVDFETGPDGPSVSFRFSDFEAVPTARRAHAQVVDGTIRDCSVGFSNTKRRDPTDEELEAFPGVREVIYEAELDEVSLVLRGAVPGAKVLSVRTAAGSEATVPEELVIDLAKRIVAKELTYEEAKTALDLAAAREPTDGEALEPDAGDEAAEAEQLAELEAEVDSILDGRGALR